MPSTETHRCCVCANETEIRCAACSAVGTDLFFCSKEHQKLVWKVHKRFCRQAIFEHPLLEPEEAEHAKRIAVIRAIAPLLPGQPLESSAATAFIGSVIDTVTSTSAHPVAQRLSGPTRQGAAQVIRAFLLNDPSRAPDHPLLTPFAFLAHIEQRIIDRLADPAVHRRSWYPVFMHRLAVVLAVFAAPQRMEPAASSSPAAHETYRELTALCGAAYAGLVELVESRVRPVESEAVVAAIRGALGDTFWVPNEDEKD
ncbi:hypothetical protein JCM10207_000205 [Rhodosporidiobolus poonsookiae]